MQGLQDRHAACGPLVPQPPPLPARAPLFANARAVLEYEHVVLGIDHFARCEVTIKRVVPVAPVPAPRLRLRWWLRPFFRLECLDES